MELKLKTGDRFEDALNQTVDEVTDAMDLTVDVLVVIQKGTEIGGFEYHNDIDPRKDIVPHFKKCLSLTQGYPDGTDIVAPKLAKITLKIKLVTEIVSFDYPMRSSRKIVIDGYSLIAVQAGANMHRLLVT